MTSGTATVVSAATSIRTDGKCLLGTLDAMATAGPKPMSATGIQKVRKDAEDLVGAVVAAYSADIAEGELGANGTARASASAVRRNCTGLLYGRIQSGKTAAMIGLAAAAIDNGFRVIVVLTSDNVKLVSQTTERFAALEGPIALDALNPSAWSEDHKHIGKHLAEAGVVFVCSKNKDRLDGLIEFLKKIGAPEYPALILDDEADQATLDANTGKRTRAKKKDPKSAVDPTAIHARVADALRTTLRHHVFLQVTATPYALLLQSVGTALRPSFTKLLEPGEGYTGGEFFFEAHHVDGPMPPIIFVDSAESTALANGATDAPDGLRRAITTFLAAAGIQGITDPALARAGQNFLCHTSALRTQHRNLETLIRAYVDRVGEDLDAGKGEGLNRIHAAYDEIAKTCESCPPLDAVIEQIRRRLIGRRIIVVNSETETDIGRSLNLIIGGNILGRGVTVDNLLVTYYLREPRVGQMDTMLQHARMYGYRSKLMHLTRVFLPQQLAVRFHEIHSIERRLRRQLTHADLGKPISIERTSALQPTRRAVLDPDYIDAFEAGEQVYPHYPDLSMSSKEYEAIRVRIQELLGAPLNAESRLVEIAFDDLLSLVKEFPYDEKEESSSWAPSVIVSVLERQRERCGNKAWLYTRKMARRRRCLTTGALSGAEMDEFKNLRAPVFCAFRDDGERIQDYANPRPYWYPTVVFDNGMPSVIVNVTDDE